MWHNSIIDYQAVTQENLVYVPATSIESKF